MFLVLIWYKALNFILKVFILNTQVLVFVIFLFLFGCVLCVFCVFVCFFFVFEKHPFGFTI